MRQHPNKQLDLADALTPEVSNKFLEQLNTLIDWRAIARTLDSLYTSKVGRLPYPPLVCFKMLVLQHFYNLSDPMCEEWVSDRISWRRFVGLGMKDPVPDETTLVRFRQRLIDKGLSVSLLENINQELKRRGYVVRKATIVDATIIESGHRAPKRGEGGKDPDADYTVKNNEPRYGYKAHVASDVETDIIHQVELTSASVHDSQVIEQLVSREDREIYADKAYDGEPVRKVLESKRIESKILKRARAHIPLSAIDRAINRIYSSTRVRIEKIFGHWKRVMGYRRVRYRGWEKNRLELEIKSICWNLKRGLRLAEI